LASLGSATRIGFVLLSVTSPFVAKGRKMCIVMVP
jgi:hypothetical protein